MKKIFGFSASDYFDLHKKIVDLLFDEHMHSGFSFEKLAQNSAYIDPLPYAGMELSYGCVLTGEIYDDSRNYEDEIKCLSTDGVFSVLNGSQFVKEAFSVYEKLDLQLRINLSDEELKINRTEYERLGLNFQEAFIKKKCIGMKLDMPRFIGQVAMHYCIFLYENLHRNELRKKNRTPAEIRDKLLGKGKSGNGPLKKIIALVKDGYGLTNSTNNAQLLELLHRLERQALSLTVFNPRLVSHFNDPKKRFSIRLLARMLSKYGDKQSDKIKLVVYHLARALDKPEIVETREASDKNLRGEINGYFDLVLQHKEAVLTSAFNPEYISG